MAAIASLNNSGSNSWQPQHRVGRVEKSCADAVVPMMPEPKDKMNPPHKPDFQAFDSELLICDLYGRSAIVNSGPGPPRACETCRRHVRNAAVYALKSFDQETSRSAKPTSEQSIHGHFVTIVITSRLFTGMPSASRHLNIDRSTGAGSTRPTWTS